MGVGPVQLANLECNGLESSLLNCSHSNGAQCTHEDDATIKCSTGMHHSVTIYTSPVDVWLCSS